MTLDRPFLGVVLMMGFCIVAPMGDAVAKILGQTVPLGQLVLIRFAVQALLLLPLIVIGGRTWRMSRRVLAITVLRTAMHIFGIGMMVAALQYLPLADAVAITFVMPFMMLVLGRYILKETVGARRLVACAIGFAGTLMVVQPSFAEVGWPALLPFGVALNFTLFMLLTRTIAKKTDPIGLQGVSGVIAVAIMTPLVMFGPATGLSVLDRISPTDFEWFLLLGIGGLGTLAHLLMTWSLRFAPGATLAPMQYLEIPIATGLGWLIFHDLPNRLALAGICITVGAGLFVMLCEKKASTQARQMSEPRQPEPVHAPAE